MKEKRGIRAYAEKFVRNQLKEEIEKGIQTGEFAEQLKIDLELPLAEMTLQSRKLVKVRIKDLLAFFYSIKAV